MIDNTPKLTVISRIIKKLKADRKLEYAVYASLFAAALIIFAASGGISCAESNSDPHGAGSAGYNDNSVEGARSEEEIEAALAEILSGISGAGKVKVMISTEEGEYGSASNADQSDIWRFGTGYGGSGSGSEKKTRHIITGVIVVAQGAGDIRVKSDIIDAVRSLLGLEPNRIGVYSMQP